MILRFGEGVAFSITGLSLIHHSRLLILLGHDVLKSGKPENQWSYVGEDRRQVDGMVHGYLKFSGDHRVVHRPLYWVPSEAAESLTNRPQPEPCRIPVAPTVPTM